MLEKQAGARSCQELITAEVELQLSKNKDGQFNNWCWDNWPFILKISKISGTHVKKKKIQMDNNTLNKVKKQAKIRGRYLQHTCAEKNQYPEYVLNSQKSVKLITKQENEQRYGLEIHRRNRCVGHRQKKDDHLANNQGNAKEVKNQRGTRHLDGQKLTHLQG